MKNSNKKGFTIVELVIVIAVVAVLAAVLIPTFTSLVKKANLSADQQAVRNMNTAAAIGAAEGKFANPSDVLDVLYAHGFNLGKMQTYSNGFHYAYNYEENKVYLLDESDNVIYPEETSKDKLWGFYYNAVEGKLDGVSKYIAMTNVNNHLNFTAAFGSGEYSIDLNGYYIDLGDAGSSSVTIFNGAYVSGNVAKDDSVKTYEKTAVDMDVKEYSYKIFEAPVFSGYNGVTFTNCIFYNASMQFNGNVTFENCQFIGANEKNAAALQFYFASGTAAETVTINNCEFTDVARAINLTCGTDGDLDRERTVNITNCVFNAVTVAKHIIQVRHTNTKVIIDNCEFTGLGESPNIIRFHEGAADEPGYSNLVNNVTFTNNTIASEIPAEKYVDTDGVATDAAKALDDAMTNKMK